MNVLTLIKKLDETPLEREIRAGDYHVEIITFYNENDEDFGLNIDGVEYNNIVQVCIVLKEEDYHAYIQCGENIGFIKLNIVDIKSIINLFKF